MKWLNEINLYDEEIKSFESRLEEVVVRYTYKSVLANFLAKNR